VSVESVGIRHLRISTPPRPAHRPSTLASTTAPGRVSCVHTVRIEEQRCEGESEGCGAMPSKNTCLASEDGLIHTTLPPGDQSGVMRQGLTLRTWTLRIHHNIIPCIHPKRRHEARFNFKDLDLENSSQHHTMHSGDTLIPLRGDICHDHLTSMAPATAYVIGRAVITSAAIPLTRMGRMSTRAVHNSGSRFRSLGQPAAGEPEME